MQFVSRVFPSSGKDTQQKRSKVTESFRYKENGTASTATAKYNVVSPYLDKTSKRDIMCISTESLKDASTWDMLWLAQLKKENRVINVPGIPKVAIIKC